MEKIKNLSALLLIASSKPLRTNITNKKRPMVLHFALGLVLGIYIGAIVTLWVISKDRMI